jgi:hypothetical protein
MGFAVTTVFGLALGIISYILSAAFLLPRMPSGVISFGAFLYLVGSLMAMIWFLIGGISSRGVGSIRKTHPLVVESIRRFKKPGEFLGKYFPRLIVDGKTYYSIIYWAYEGLNSTKETGVLVLDDQGKIITDKDTAKKVAKCHYLATLTIDDSYGVRRSDNAEKAFKSIETIKKQKVLLQEQKPYFEALGMDVEQAREKINASADTLRELFEANTQADTLEAEWGQQRGFHRMAECRYEDVLELESRMKSIMQPQMEKKELTIEGGKAAEKLIYAINQHGVSIHVGNEYFFLKRKRNIMEFLDILKMTGLEARTLPERWERLGFSDTQWELWKNRTDYALALEKGR